MFAWARAELSVSTSPLCRWPDACLAVAAYNQATTTLYKRRPASRLGFEDAGSGLVLFWFRTNSRFNVSSCSADASAPSYRLPLDREPYCVHVAAKPRD
ncbi:hypothetical protein CPB86DRAFT_401503 [Serendipita vermifera]|nr:hypothetical protein CPB86DRAFT_401503 [Serendipita vermifera]